MTNKDIMAIVATVFDKGASCTVVVNKSADKTMRKGRGINRNPYLGRVTMIKTYIGYGLGMDYKSNVDDASKRMGNADADAKLRKTWHKPCTEYGEWFSTDKKTESKVYLKLGRNAKRVGYKVETIYYLDGHVADATERKAIEEWITERSDKQSATQLEVGLDKEHEQQFILPELCTITSIRQGEREIRPQEMLVDSLTPVFAVATR